MVFQEKVKMQFKVKPGNNQPDAPILKYIYNLVGEDELDYVGETTDYKTTNNLGSKIWIKKNMVEFVDGTIDP